LAKEIYENINFEGGMSLLHRKYGFSLNKQKKRWSVNSLYLKAYQQKSQSLHFFHSWIQPPFLLQ